jgi:predicted MFS family arabinose efflux permease
MDKTTIFLLDTLLCLLMSLTVFGIFTYSGQLISQGFDYNIFTDGATLSLFGVGIIFTSQLMPTIKEGLKLDYMPFKGSLISCALLSLSSTQSPALLCLCLLVFGAGFILFRPVFIAKIQEQIPHIKGSIMSTALFGLFVGGAIGSAVNGFIINYWDMHTILHSAVAIIFISEFIATVVIPKLDTHSSTMQSHNPC